MTISTTASTVTVAGNSLVTAFNFGFVYAAASDIQVAFIDASGNETILAQGSQYTLSLNPPAVGQIWGVGGTVTYPLAGPPIAAGTFLTISRIVPFTQLVSISNQGNFYPQVVEKAMDLLEMQIQEVGYQASRAIVINPADPFPASPLPLATVRANQYAFFDSQGNLTAGLPAFSGAIISSAMQPVVAASTTAAALALLGTLNTFPNIETLRVNAIGQPAVVFVEGYWTGADGGGGFYWLNAADTTSDDNGGTIIVDALGHRWYLETFGAPLSVLQFGAKGDGTTPDAAAFNAALAACGTTRYAIAPGGKNYLLGSLLAPTEAALITQGATYVDPENCIPVWDPVIFAICQYNFNQALSRAGDGTSGSANQFGMAIQVSAPVTNSPAAYEKAALYVTANTQDPTTYGDGGVTRDLVGIEVHAITNVASPALGRIWGYHTTVEVAPGTDGNAIGFEIEVQNHGSNSGIFGDVETGKVGMNIISTGEVPGTAALVIRDEGSSWNAGIQFITNALSPGAQALIIPNGCPISSFDTEPAIRNMLLINNSNQVIIGDSALSAIGAQSTLLPTLDNALVLGSSANRWTAVWAVNGAIQTSDPSLKTDVTPLPAALPIVAKINPVTFKWKQGGYTKETVTETKEVQDYEDIVHDEEEIVYANGVVTAKKVQRTERKLLFDAVPVVDADGKPVIVHHEARPPRFDAAGKMISPGRPARSFQRMYQAPRMVKKEVTSEQDVPRPGARTHWGFLASDIKAAIPEGMDWAAYVKGEDGTEHIRPDQLIPVLWKAVQELSAKVAALEGKKS